MEYETIESDARAFFTLDIIAIGKVFCPWNDYLRFWASYSFPGPEIAEQPNPSKKCRSDAATPVEHGATDICNVLYEATNFSVPLTESDILAAKALLAAFKEGDNLEALFVGTMALQRHHHLLSVKEQLQMFPFLEKVSYLNNVIFGVFLCIK